MVQADLFPPASHATDPASSFEAEARVTKSGKRKKDQDIVYDCLLLWPESTAAELHQKYTEFQTRKGLEATVDVVTFRRRLSDMKGKRVERRNELRICRVAGTRAAVWCVK